MDTTNSENIIYHKIEMNPIIKYWYDDEGDSKSLQSPKLRRCPNLREINYAINELKKDKYPFGSTHRISRHYNSSCVYLTIYLVKEEENVYIVLDKQCNFNCTVN